MNIQTIYHTWQRYKTLQTNKITTLPIVVLMPHSACNCRCVMCDIWKDNKNLKQLSEKDITGLLTSLKKLGTKQIAMSGGEALLNSNFFKLCELLKEQHITISLLSTGLSVRKYANELLHYVDELIVSLDGDEALHDAIRNVPQAFNKLKDGVQYIKSLRPSYPITGRTVIHRLNFHNWQAIINQAHKMGLDQISFLPADVTSHAFNRQTAWNEPKQHEILLTKKDLPALKQVINNLLSDCQKDFRNGFIAESPSKIRDIYYYYAAFYKLNPFPYKKCNAPWVSTVVEADGSVKPCFFHDSLGNIHEQSLTEILNSSQAMNFRKSLDMATNPICVKCVCSLNLSPLTPIN